MVLHPADPTTRFRIDPESGPSPYVQLIHQVQAAVCLGLLTEGDQLPTVKELAARLVINQNTVLKAYRELAYDGVVTARSGMGTFIAAVPEDVPLAACRALSDDLHRRLAEARRSGLTDDLIEALVGAALRAPVYPASAGSAPR